MTFKIANKLVVTFHRPEAEKQRKPNEKDAYRATQHPTLVPSRHSAPTRRPLVEISKVTALTQFPTAGAVQREIDRRPKLHTVHEVVTQVRNHLLARLTAYPAQPVLLLVGGNHDTDLEVAVGMSAVSVLQGEQRKKLLIEQRPQHMVDLEPTVNGFHQAFAQAVARKEPFDPPGGVSPASRALTNVAFGRSLGYTTGGFDVLHDDAQNIESRESQMVASISKELVDTNVVIVSCGATHVAALHQALAPNVNTVAISLVSPALPGDTEDVKRMSYLLATPEILAINPTEALYRASIDATTLARRLMTP